MTSNDRQSKTIDHYAQNAALTYEQTRAKRDMHTSNVLPYNTRAIVSLLNPNARQAPILERIGSKLVVWTDYNRDLTAGYYLTLDDDTSSIIRVSVCYNDILATKEILP